jgi:Flp pilus assembly protein TadD
MLASLMAKPMLVTLPFLLLLLDYWPLRRILVGSSNNESNYIVYPIISFRAVLIEKTPLLLLTIASGVITFVAQKSGGAVNSIGDFPIWIRVANGLFAYVRYISHMIVPNSLSIMYLHPGYSLSIWEVIGSFIVLASLSYIAVIVRKHNKYILVGWFWYLGTLVPVLGLIQVGYQAMADRYTYVPMVGLYIIIAWIIPESIIKNNKTRYGFILFVTCIVLLLIIQTRSQLYYWVNSVRLFRHAVELDSNNWLAHYNLGVGLDEVGETEYAIAHYSKAVQLKPDYYESYNNLGRALSRQNRIEEALFYYKTAVKVKPDFAEAHNNIGTLLARTGNIKEAITHYKEAIRINPDFAEAYYNLGLLMWKVGMKREAIMYYRNALRIMPDFKAAQENLNICLSEIDSNVIHRYKSD